MPSPEEAHAYTKRMPVIGICLAIATAATYNGILLLMAQQGHHRNTIKSSFAPRSSDSSSFGRPSLQYEETTFCHSRAHHQKASASRKKARFIGLWPGGAHAFESASKFMTHLVRQEMAPAYPLRPGRSAKMLAAASLSEGGRV